MVPQSGPVHYGPAPFGANISMSNHRNRKLYELSVILRWLKHRERLATAAMDRYALIFRDTGFSYAKSRIAYHHGQRDALRLFTKQVELDIRTLVAGRSGPGVKGRKRQCHGSNEKPSDSPSALET